MTLVRPEACTHSSHPEWCHRNFDTMKQPLYVKQCASNSREHRRKIKIPLPTNCLQCEKGTRPWQVNVNKSKYDHFKYTNNQNWFIGGEKNNPNRKDRRGLFGARRYNPEHQVSSLSPRDPGGRQWETPGLGTPYLLHCGSEWVWVMSHVHPRRDAKACSDV